MSHLNPGLLAAYNSLTDKHLTGYFNNARIRRHLQKVGLITRSGRIVPDKEYKHKLIQRAHQRHVRECLAQAIFHKVLDMERLHQTEIKRKLEEFARRERIHKLKTERSKRYEDEPMLMLSPRPPTGPKISHARNSGPEGEHSESTESPGSSRPNTAPGKMQRPVRLKPLNSNSATASLKRTSPRYRLQDRESSNDTDQPLSYTLDRDTMRHLTMTDFSSTVSPYRLPVINNYVTPVPPLTKKKERGPRVNGTLRGRRLRPTTAPTAPTEPSTLQRTSAQSKVSVRMVFFGKSVHLSHDLMDLRDEVKVFQQHCGGENLCVFKGKLKEGEMFQFVSRRHRGFPFSLTFFLNGLQVDRLSSCCEFKHRKGARLGGKHGHFGFCGVEGASPCYKCIIAMGLDKKPTPPLKRVKEELPTSKSPDEKEATDVDEEIDTHTNAGPDRSQEMETQPNGETAQQKKPKDDYEEDFEADDEGPVEDGDEVDEKPSPAANDGEIENETRDVNEKNRDSDSEAEDIDVSKDKRAMSVSSGRTSSLSSSDGDNSEREMDGDTKEVPEESLQPEEDTKETKMDETESESSPVTLTQAAEEDPGTRENPGDGMEKSEQETSEDTETKGGTEGEKAGEVEDETKPEDKPQESEPERAAKSMQEKLSEAILKESQCSSEPELSDTSTEEDEGASVKTQQDSKEAESAVTPSSPQQLNTQEDIPEESEVNTQKAPCKETAHGIETSQPAEGTIPAETYTNTEEEKEEKQEKEEITASLEIEKKQEEEESDRKNEVEEDEKDELQLESEAQTEGDKQEVEEEVKDEDKINEIVEVSNESKEEEMSKSKDSSEEEPKTNPQTLNTSNNGNEDTTVMENEIPETESALENENSEFHIENEIETGASDIERQGDADQNTGRKSNGQTDGDERDGWTNETSNDRSTGEKVQETDGMVDDEGSVVTEKDEEKSGDQRVHGKELDEIMNGEEVQEDKTVVEERPEELENGVNNDDQGIEETEKEGEIQASEKKIELEEYEDSKSEDKEKEVDIVREESGVNDKQEVINKEQSCEAEDKENELDGEAFIPENEDHDEQKEPENEKQVRSKFSDRPMEEGQENGGDEIVGGETEQAKDENAENGEQEVKKEAEVEDKKRDEVEEAVSENCVENETKEWENKNELETGEKLIEDLKCDEAETEVTDVNEISENAEVKDVKEEALSGESVAQKPEDSIMDQNEKPVSHEEEKEIISSGMPKDDTGPSIKEDAGETLPAVVNNDQLACNIDAENGEAGNFSQEEAEKEEYSKDEKVPDKLEGEGSVDSSQKVVNDGETDKEEKEEEIDDEKEQGTEKDTETKSDVALSERESQKEGEHEDQGNDNQKSDRVDDKPMTEEPGRESETSAAAFRENIAPENLTKDAESEIIFSEEDGVDDKPMTEEPDMESETSAATFRENIDPENLAKDAESEIIVSEEAGVMEEPHDTESELKGSNGELRSREAPEGENSRAKDGEPEEPGEKKENSLNEEKSASSVSHSVESQPVEKVSALKKDEKDPVLSADSEEPAIRPAALAKADGADLVSNWINIHQTSRYFQTFIEPLDEIKEGVISDETEKWPNGEVLDATDTIPSTDFGGHDETLTSRDEIAAPSENDHNENTEPDTLVESFKQETKAEASEADAQSEPSENNKHDPANDEGVKNGRDTRGSLVTSCSKQSDDVDTHQKETDGQEAPTSNVVMNLETEVATTENIQDVPTETEQDLLRNYELKSSFQEESKQNKQETTVDEITSLSSISQREGESNKETLESSEHNLKSEHVAQSEFIEPESPTITVITDLTIINKSENGSQDDTASVDFHSKKSDGSRDTDGNRGTKVIDGSFKQTLSQDRLSTFPLDDSRFYGPAGYPRLTTANTENSY